MAALSDVITVAQNIVTAINALAKTYLAVQGSKNAANVSSATLVSTGAGRIATVSVTTAGSAAGAVYDAAVVTATTNKLYSIPNTVGVYLVNLPTSYGIVVAPGSGQVVAIGYS